MAFRILTSPEAAIVAVLGACHSAWDRLIVLLMARAGLRRAEGAPAAAAAAMHRHVQSAGRVKAAWLAGGRRLAELCAQAKRRTTVVGAVVMDRPAS